MFKQTSRRRKSGFTLIELAIIIAVIGILGAVGAVKFASMTDDANRSAAYSTLANLRSALAIAIAKDANGAVTDAEFATYLDPTPTTATFAGFTWNGYAVTLGGAAAGITSVTSCSKGGVTVP